MDNFIRYLKKFFNCQFSIVNCKLPPAFYLFLLILPISFLSYYFPQLFFKNEIKEFIGLNEKVYIEGKILRELKETRHNKQFIFQVFKINDKKINGKILLRLKPNNFFNSGDKIAFYSKIRSFESFKNPNAFDYSKYMFFKEKCLANTSLSKLDNILIFEKAPLSFFKKTRKDYSKFLDELYKTSSFWSNSNSFVGNFSSFLCHSSSFLCHSRVGGNPEKIDIKSIIKSLSIGNQSELTNELRDDFQKTGTSHLLAISGLHLGIIASFSFFIFRFLLSHFKILTELALLRKFALILSIIPIVFYSIISGMQPSTQRALIMVSFFILAFAIEKESNTYNILFLAAFLILVINPTSIFLVSFQLSFLSVFTIIYGFQQYHIFESNFFSRVIPAFSRVIPAFSRVIPAKAGIQTQNYTESYFLNRHLRKLFLFFLISVFATLGTSPIISFYFNQVSLISVFANFIVVPLIAFIALPLILISFFSFFISPQIAVFFIFLSNLILKLSLIIIKFFADLKFSSFLFSVNLLELILLTLLAFLIISFLNGITKKKIAILFCLVLFLLIDSSYWIYKRFYDPNLEITIIDVKNGFSSLIKLPNSSKCILIDGGGFNNSDFDIGRQVIADFLLSKKIKTIDTVILTHPDEDHLNGLLYILKNFNVKEVISNNEKSNIQTYHQFLEIIKEKKILHYNFEELERSFFIEGVKFEIFYPEKDFLQKKPFAKFNNNSLVFKVSYKDKSILFTGDIEKEAEQNIVKMHKENLKSTILISPHHGSKTSSTTHFLNCVKPEIIIVSSAKNKPYGVHKEVLKRYLEIKAKIYSTKENGAIKIEL